MIETDPQQTGVTMSGRAPELGIGADLSPPDVTELASQAGQAGPPLATASSRPVLGLTTAEAEARRAQGLGNDLPMRSSRSYRLILRENIFTFINTSLFVLGLALIVLGRPTDVMVSLGVVLINVTVSVLQEVRAKRKLDRIALLARPTATVLRDGQERTLDPGQIVQGDVLIARPGDQVVADGRFIGDGAADLDESLLTGESELVPKRAGDAVYSGSFCVSGSVTYEAERVGARSLASQITTTARAFRRVTTPLQLYVTLIVRVLLLAAVFIEILLIGVTLIYNTPVLTVIQNSVVVVGLVPQGLFLSIAVAYALGAVRVAGQAILVQQSNTIESLSNVDVLCLDKTGTLTANRIRLEDTHPVGVPADLLARLLGDFARSVASSNRTSDALAEACPGSPRQVSDEVPFASVRKWSGLAFDDPELRGAYILGAPEILAPYVITAGREERWAFCNVGEAPDDAVIRHLCETEWEDTNRANEASAGEPQTWQGQADAWAERGLRVVLLTRADPGGADGIDATGVSLLRDAAGQPRLPARLLPLGLVAFSDELRPDAAETLARFAAAGIELKVISGDNPHTVAALARQAGLGPEIRSVSGLSLAGMDDAEFAQAAQSSNVFGRITPDQKARLVHALKARGHYVAMTGDGINDVMALKQAHLGIAMETGSQASRAVADLVLMGDSFAVLPCAFEEGQRIRNGMQDVLKLFLTRLIVVTLLVGAVGFVGGFAFTPKQVSLVGFLTVGIPTIVLATRARPGLAGAHSRLLAVFHFVLPAGLSLAMTALTTYLVVLYVHSRSLMTGPADLPHGGALQAAMPAAQSALATILVLCGLILVTFVVPPVRGWHPEGSLTPDGAGFASEDVDWRPSAIAALLLTAYVVIVATPSLRSFFDLAPLAPLENALIVCEALTWALLLRWAWRAQVLERFLYGSETPALT